MNRRKFIKRLGFTAGGLLLTGSYPLFVERYLIRTNHYEILLPGLPESFDGFTIVHLTDLHFGLLVPEMIIEYVIAQALDIKKDIIVCTGDYVHERKNTEQIDKVWPLLFKLKASGGVFNVLGNHDHWADTDRSLYYLEKSGQNLRHKVKEIKKGNDKIWIGGAGDLWEDEDGIDQAFANVPERDFKILLAHNPDTADMSYTTKIDLVLSGHTHGGQVNIPFYGPPILPVKNKLYSDGIVNTGRSKMFISKGIGWAILPVRF